MFAAERNQISSAGTDHPIQTTAKTQSSKRRAENETSMGHSSRDGVASLEVRSCKHNSNSFPFPLRSACFSCCNPTAVIGCSRPSRDHDKHDIQLCSPRQHISMDLPKTPSSPLTTDAQAQLVGQRPSIKHPVFMKMCG